ncbi:hypothetical protein P1X15_29805 [Runella sp. MFBS21]|uniref:hypothetical protein n=1 Tax=Runella sp. MFBS21 TaxID=3034018 RepID=UPI0023F61847|nr:hypothetical protein [Runella sp. MFBS21]MDF7821848.1 hypothetical protein [Runella sp. MFBS21]
MISLEEIRKRKMDGKRKWGFPLLAYVIPKLQQGYTYDAVADWLHNEHDIQITAKQLIELKARAYKEKIAVQNNPQPIDNTKNTTISPPNQDVDFYAQIQEEVKRKEEQRRLEKNADFFSKFGKK